MNGDPVMFRSGVYRLTASSESFLKRYLSDMKNVSIFKLKAAVSFSIIGLWLRPDHNYDMKRGMAKWHII